MGPPLETKLGTAAEATPICSGQPDYSGKLDQDGEGVAGATSDGATGADVGSRNDTVFVVDRDFLDAHPDVVRAVYDALSSATAAALEDPSILRAARATHGLSEEVVAFLEQSPQATIEPVTPKVQAAWQQEADFWTENGIIPDRLDVAKSAST